MTLVVDSSAVAASLVDGGAEGDWIRSTLSGQDLWAPAHLHVEVSSVLRRLVIAGRIGRAEGALAHGDLLELHVTTVAFGALAARVWELHPSVTAYDAAYVALAEELGAPLLTLDRRLGRADGPACDFLLPPQG